MVVKELTGCSVSLRQSEEETGFVPDLLTWPYQTWLSFAKRGLSVYCIDEISFDAFIKAPTEVLINQYGKSLAMEFIEGMDLAKEVAHVQDCQNNPLIEKFDRAATLDDISLSLKKGYIPIVALNYYALQQKDGFEGHAVVVESETVDAYVLQDPGPPGRRNWSVSKELFCKAWFTPGVPAEMMAVGCVS